jgi:hypothetical protein
MFGKRTFRDDDIYCYSKPDPTDSVMEIDVSAEIHFAATEEMRALMFTQSQVDRASGQTFVIDEVIDGEKLTGTLKELGRL